MKITTKNSSGIIWENVRSAATGISMFISTVKNIKNNKSIFGRVRTASPMIKNEMTRKIIDVTHE